MNKNTTESSIHPCCNLILWDILISFTTATRFGGKILPSPSNFLESIFTLVLLIIIALIPVILMAVPYLGYIVQLIFSIFWTLAGYELLNKIFDLSESPLWQRIIAAFIIFLIIWSIHLTCSNQMNLFSFDSFRKISHEEFQSTGWAVQEKVLQCLNRYDLAIELTNTVNTLPNNDNSLLLKDYIKNNASKIVRQANHLRNSTARYSRSSTALTLHRMEAALSDSIPLIENYINSLQNLLSDYNQDINAQAAQPKTNSQAIFFKGCNTLESLNKRYKDLVKIYHPDSGNGNDKVFIEITEEYEGLKSSFDN